MLGFETGFQFSNTDFNEQYDVGQLVLRYGLSEKLELRALLGSYTSVNESLLGGERTTNGFQDMGVGAKYNLLSADGKPSISALAELSLPVGSDEFTNDEFVPSVSLLSDHSFNENLGVSSNLGYAFGVGNIEDRWLFTLTAGFGITNKIAGYLGYAGVYYGNFEEHWIEGGLPFMLNNGIQLDLNFGYDMENEITFLGAGFATGF